MVRAVEWCKTAADDARNIERYKDLKWGGIAGVMYAWLCVGVEKDSEEHAVTRRSCVKTRLGRSPSPEWFLSVGLLLSIPHDSLHIKTPLFARLHTFCYISYSNLFFLSCQPSSSRDACCILTVKPCIGSTATHFSSSSFKEMDEREARRKEQCTANM